MTKMLKGQSQYLTKASTSMIKTGRFAKLLYPTLLSLLFIFMLRLSWRKWADILIDFGRELYLPWQISEGKVLYRDLAHIFGPISQYFNAFLFKLFGVSYSVIIAANIIILILFLVFLYIMLSRIFSNLIAFVCCTVVIVVFSMSQLTLGGNQNFISPYAHEATHGLILAFFIIFFLWKFIEKKRMFHLICAGFFFGLIYLTKIEIVFASVIALVVFFFLITFKKPIAGIPKIKLLLSFIIPALIPALCFFIYFTTQMSPNAAVRAISNIWLPFIKSQMVENYFYSKSLGLDNIWNNIANIAQHVSMAMFILIVLAYISRKVTYYSTAPKIVLLYSICLTFIYLMALTLNEYRLGLSIPALTTIAAAIVTVEYLRNIAKNEGIPNSLIIYITWSVFSIALLGKILLNCRLYHFGFYLVIPAVVFLIAFCLNYLPSRFFKSGLHSSTFRAIIISLIFVLSFKYFITNYAIYSTKTFPVIKGSDRILTYNRNISPVGPLFAEATEWLTVNVREKETLLVIPEGVMLNYLIRRENPTVYINFMPPELGAFGESNILEAFRKKLPDYIVIAHKNMKIYGVNFFGTDLSYGKKIMDWVNKNYYPIKLFGNEPLINNKFGIKILKRKPATVCKHTSSNRLSVAD